MTNILFCKLCGELIYFDNEHVSEKSGKKIPLDRDTGDPHNCLAWKPNYNRRYHVCSKGCGDLIYFDSGSEEGINRNGKWVPLSKDTGKRHQCQW